MVSLEPDLVERSGDLKRALVAFAKEKRFARELKATLGRRFGSAKMLTEGESIELLDFFILEHKLADSRTVVEHFLDTRPKLSARERAMLAGWRDVVYGIFEVRARDQDSVEFFGLLD